MMSCAREKAPCVVVVVAALITLVCIGLLINLLVVLDSRREASKQQNENQRICLPCNTLSGDEGAWRSWRKQEDGKSCCTQDLSELSVVLGMVLKRKQSYEEPLPGYDPHKFSLGRASAQKVLVPSDNFLKNTNKPKSGENDPLFFNPDRHVPLLEHVNNIEVTREGFKILVSGRYYVYSNVMFRSDSNKLCKDHRKQTWEHKVVKTSVRDRNNSEAILQSELDCDNCARYEETRFAGGVFYLEADDFLHVEVTDEELISYNKYASYMGLTMISHDRGMCEMNNK